MGNGKFGVAGFILIFVTVSLVFQMDFSKQSAYVFDALDIDIEEMTNDAIDEVLSKAENEVFNQGFYTYPEPTTIENKISEEKYSKLTKIIDLEKDEKAILIRGYEEEGYVVARYYIEPKEDMSNQDIITSYQEKLINNGYEEIIKDYTNTKFYHNDKIEISFVDKWDCIILIVKGL